jgi:OOP family OmpA-OmpF porin
MTVKIVTRLNRFFTIAVFLSASLAVQADVGDWYVTPSVAYSDDEGDRLIDDSVAGGQVQLGKEMSEHFWLEGLLGYHDIDGFPGQKHLELGINAVGNFLPESTFSPYAIGGIGVLRADVGLPDFGGSPTAGTTATDLTATAGLGLKIRFGESPWSLRAEWRVRHAFASDNALTDQIGSLGLQYTFGGGSSAPAAIASAPMVDADSDGDGVVDSRDACPNTRSGVVVDLTGCPQDADQDGVKNIQDKCPETPAGAMVDLNGCEIPDGISMKRIYFPTGTASFDSESRAALDETVKLLLRYPGLPVEIAGHADARGSEDFNMALSLVRAEVVRLYLEQAGVRASSLSTVGYGESDPIATNDTAEGQAQNRRVVLEMHDR